MSKVAKKFYSSDFRLGLHPLSERLGLLSDLIELLSRLSLQVSKLKAHTMVVGKSLLMSIQKIPVESREWTGFVAGRFLRVVTAVAAVVPHFVNIVATGTVGL